MNATTLPLDGDANRRYRPTHGHEPPPGDIATVQQMRGQLYQLICQGGNQDYSALPCTIYLPEPSQRTHRVVLVNSAALRESADLSFVGFFGQKRPESDAAILEALDGELIQEFQHHPQLLSYSSLELPDGSWANLVLMSNSDMIAHWAKGKRHAYAAHHIAPACYTTIRLHNGLLYGGLAPAGGMQFLQTRLFDFTRPIGTA